LAASPNPGEDPAWRAPRFNISKDGVLLARRARGRTAVDKGETENVNPFSSVLLGGPTSVRPASRRGPIGVDRAFPQ
jgi:hypothetical protein